MNNKIGKNSNQKSVAISKIDLENGKKKQKMLLK